MLVEILVGDPEEDNFLIFSDDLNFIKGDNYGTFR